YQQYVALDVELDWLHADLVADPPGLGEGHEALPRPPSAASVSPRRASHGRLVMALAASLLLILGLGGFLSNRGPHSRESPVSARVAEVRGEATILTADGRVLPAVAGLGLVAGQTLRIGGEESFAVVEYPDATRLELNADTVIRLAPAEAATAAGKKV